MIGKHVILNILKGKALPLSAALLLLVPSCAKLERQDAFSDVPMEFGTYTPTSSTKAHAGTYVSGTTLPAGTSFGVFAFYQPGVIGSSTGTWNNSRKPDFMFNCEVSSDDYSYSPLKYWPSNEENTISFWAYYPYSIYSANNTGALKLYESDGSTAYTNNSTGLPVVKYTVPNDPDQQYDLLFDSFASTDKTLENCSPTPGTVPLTFRHALSLVELHISADNGSLPENASITITEFQFSNVYSRGTCTNPSASIADGQHPENYWTDVNTLAEMTLSTSGTVTRLILMPQALVEEGSTGHSLVHLYMKYDIVFPAAHDPSQTISYADNEVNAYIWSDNGTPYGIKRWLPGRKYKYRINAGLERIEFSEVTEASWTEEWPTP